MEVVEMSGRVMKRTGRAGVKGILSGGLRDQGARRARLVRIINDWCGERFDSQGRWTGREKEPNTRGRMWLCFGLLAGDQGDRELANVILERTEFRLHVPARTPEEAQAHFDIFISNHAVQMVALHADKLRPAVRAKMESWARYALGDYPGDRQADYQFHGYNDNMPCKATMGLILGGEYFEDRRAVEHGLWNLRQLADLLGRRGLLSEYTSPTYIPFCLLNLTEIATCARSGEARALAGQALEHIWADVLGHFHAATGMMGGPFSRAYTIDSTGHLSNLSIVLWLAFGDIVLPNPAEELARRRMRVVHHENDITSEMGLAAWLSPGHYAPPAGLVRWAERRRYPFHLRATAERGDSGRLSAAGLVISTSYQEKEFAFGTADAEPWTFGESLFLRYARRADRHDIGNVRTLYTRYLVDDERPRDEDHLLKNHGHMHCVQKDRVAMALVHPQRALSEREVRSLKFSVIMPTHFGAIESVRVEEGHVWVVDGPLCMALRPLNAMVWGGRRAPKLERYPHYQVISFFNYEGRPRTFTAEELCRTVNGVIITIGLRREETLRQFKRRVLGAELQDGLSFGCRTVRYRAADVELGLNYGLESNGVRFATIDGAANSCLPWEADSWPAKKLPYMRDREWRNGLRLPFEQMGVIWAPKQPWAIFANGKGRRLGDGSGK